MTTKLTSPTTEQTAYLNDLKEVLGRHANLSAIEMLAVTSHFVGVLIALQDEKTVTVGVALDVVQANIKAGNQEVVSILANTQGNA